MSLFTEDPIKTLALDHPLQYAHSLIDSANLRKTSISSSLKDKLRRHFSALKLNPQYIDELNVSDCVAKIYNIGIECDPTEEQDRLWIYASTLVVILFQFDDHFDKSYNIPENLSRISMEMRTLLRALSRHGLSGLQGDLDDWPTTVPCREAYLWLLREADSLRNGAAELTHYTFLDYCFGVEMEIMDWAPDVYRGDTVAWSLKRYDDVRKRSAGVAFAMAGPLYIANKWITKEHVTSCNDLLYDASVIAGLANDILGMKKDQEKESEAITITAIKIASANEIAQQHNEKAESFRKDIQALEGDARRFMEEMEVGVVGLFLWQLNARRYIK